jgi:hypothetical protein
LVTAIDDVDIQNSLRSRTTWLGLVLTAVTASAGHAPDAKVPLTCRLSAEQSVLRMAAFASLTPHATLVAFRLTSTAAGRILLSNGYPKGGKGAPGPPPGHS